MVFLSLKPCLIQILINSLQIWLKDCYIRSFLVWEGVADRQCFSQCILHVWCETERAAKVLEVEHAEVIRELELTNDVIMVLTVADGLYAKPIFNDYCLN